MYMMEPMPQTAVMVSWFPILFHLSLLAGRAHTRFITEYARTAILTQPIVVNHLQSSYTAALALEAAAVMWNSTGADAWKTILDGLTARTIKIFFPNGVAKEVSCEPMTCNTDMTFFKSFLHRSLASTMKVAPYTADHILPALKTSAAAAAKTCTSGANNRLCGSVWSVTSDGVTGAGSQVCHFVRHFAFTLYTYVEQPYVQLLSDAV
jgi:hypothetical protein